MVGAPRLELGTSCVFGHYAALVLRFPDGTPAARRVWAQDLLADRAVEITSRVVFDGKTMVVPGAVIDEVGTAAGSEGDISAPGLMLQVGD